MTLEELFNSDVQRNEKVFIECSRNELIALVFANCKKMLNEIHDDIPEIGGGNPFTTTIKVDDLQFYIKSNIEYIDDVLMDI